MRRKPSSLRNLKQDAREIVDRMCLVAGVKTMQGLAKKMSLKISTVEYWIAKNHVPVKYIHYIADVFDSSFDFLELGLFFDPDEVLKNFEENGYEEEYKYSYIKKPVKIVYLSLPFDDKEDLDNIVPIDNTGIITIGSHNVAVNGSNNNVSGNGDFIGEPKKSKLQSEKFKEFLELFDKYGNDSILDKFIDDFKKIKNFIERM